MSLWNTERWHLFKVVFLLALQSGRAGGWTITIIHTLCQTVNRSEGNVNKQWAKKLNKKKFKIIIMIQVALIFLFTFRLIIVHSQSYGKNIWTFNLKLWNKNFNSISWHKKFSLIFDTDYYTYTTVDSTPGEQTYTYTYPITTTDYPFTTTTDYPAGGGGGGGVGGKYPKNGMTPWVWLRTSDIFKSNAKSTLADIFCCRRHWRTAAAWAASAAPSRQSGRGRGGPGPVCPPWLQSLSPGNNRSDPGMV